MERRSAPELNGAVRIAGRVGPARVPGGSVTLQRHRAVLKLQRSAGNRAVGTLLGARSGSASAGQARATSKVAGATGGGASLESAEPVVEVEPTGQLSSALPVQRRAGGGSLPVPPPHLGPHDDPKFTSMKSHLGQSGAKAKKHPHPKTEAKNASNAAKPPSNDVGSQAKAAQVDEMGAAKPGGFDKAAFIAAVKAAIEAKSPKNLEQADGFASSGKAGEVRNEVKGRVATGKQASEKEIKGKTEKAPDPGKATPKPVEPMSPEPAAPQLTDPGSAEAMPKPAPPEQTDLSTGGNETKDQMADAQVTDQQLAKSNEPEFEGAVAAKSQATEHSNKAPGGFRAAEKGELSSAQGAASSSARTALSAMLGKRTADTGAAHGSKDTAKAKEEAERAKVAGDIEKIYDTTKGDTEKILTDLDGKVSQAFDQGEGNARAAFERSYSSQMTAYKDERYSGWRGKLRWVKDKLTSMPSEVNQFFVSAKAIYTQKMDQVISSIADMVGNELNRARARIAQGRTEIKNYVATQKGNLKKYAAESEKAIGAKFDDLDKSVDDKQEGLVDDLASKYVEARGKLDERIEELQSENKGLWEKAKDLVGGVIKTILQLKDMLMNVLARAANAVMDIIKDPIGFLGKMIEGVKAGLTRFVSNIWDHLKKGVVGWLLGALASAGIEIPDTFDLKGILKLVSSVIGLTWTNFKNRLVKKVGQPVADKIEQTVDFVKAIATGGLGAAWSWIVEKVGDIKDLILGQVKDFLVTKVIGAGIEWIISLLNPAGAFIKACKLIYSIVMFFVERAAQIKEFVDSVLDSVESITKGAIGKMASAVEDSLAKILPLAIGFLADLIGLGGISEKIQAIIKTVQKPVSKAFDFLIGKAVKIGKGFINKLKSSKLGRKVRKAKEKAKELYGKGKAYVKGKVEAGKTWVKGKVAGAKAAIGQVFSFAKKVASGSEEHTVFNQPGSNELMMQSVEIRLLNHPDAAVRKAAAAYKQILDTSPPNTTYSRATKAIKPVLTAIKAWMKANGLKGPGTSAPGLGRIAPHDAQGSSIDNKKVPEWRLESEHVIPRAWVTATFSNLGLRQTSHDEYGQMATIMIYEVAAKKKTASHDGDNVIFSLMKSIVKNDLGETYRARKRNKSNQLAAPAKLALRTAISKELKQLRTVQVAKTVKYIGEEHHLNGARRAETGPLPEEVKVAEAADKQITFIENEMTTTRGI